MGERRSPATIRLDMALRANGNDGNLWDLHNDLEALIIDEHLPTYLSHDVRDEIGRSITTALWDDGEYRSILLALLSNTGVTGRPVL